MLMPIKEKLKTITTDSGMAFSAHEVIYRALGVEVFFTDPYSSWQKGAIENANGLIRQYIPKRVSFDEYDDKDIQRIKDKINRRPRKNSISFPLKSALAKISSNFGITFLVPYNKDFGRITRFLGNDLATVLFAAFCYELRSNNSL